MVVNSETNRVYVLDYLNYYATCSVYTLPSLHIGTFDTWQTY